MCLQESDVSADTRVKYSKLLIEALRFVGDFGNVIVNGKDSDVHSSMMLLLVRLQALMCSQPHHVVWEAALATLKLCGRSHAAVRVKVYAILSGTIRLREEMHSMLQPLLSVADMTMQLHEAFEAAQVNMAEDSALSMALLPHQKKKKSFQTALPWFLGWTTSVFF